MRSKRLIRKYYSTILLIAAAFLTACGTVSDPGPAVSETSDSNDAVNTDRTETTRSAAGAIETSEPENYRATVALSVGTTGQIEAKAKALQANVARNGDKRRMEMVLPNGEKLVYLTIGERQMVVLPNRKQYAEIDKETFGLELRKLVAPDQIISQVRGYEQVRRKGEEQWYGRSVVRYSIIDETQTETRVGDVETDSFVLVDQETKLPVKTVAAVTSEQGDVMGVTGVKAVTEITNLSTEADESMFAEPTDLEKVESEDVQRQIEEFYSSAKGMVAQLAQAARNAVN
ncbi:MAG: hypothetical protein J5I65_03920 [Aridibacter famidurans]|nr:hypothetical protein [Aridibacter famidurans]